MSTVWKSGPIKNGMVFNEPGHKTITLDNGVTRVTFNRFRQRNYMPVFKIILANKSKKLYKTFTFTDEYKALKKFMHLSFNGIAR